MKGLLMPSSPAWWASVIAAIGGAVSVIWVNDIGQGVTKVCVAVAGLIIAVAQHQHYSTIRNETTAAAAVGTAESVGAKVAEAIRAEVATQLQAPKAAVPAAPVVPTS